MGELLHHRSRLQHLHRISMELEKVMQCTELAIISMELEKVMQCTEQGFKA